VDDALLRRLDAIPEVNRVTIENVVAEIGVDMEQFPTAKHLASWAGLCGCDARCARRLGLPVDRRTRTFKPNTVAWQAGGERSERSWR
jgi:transposase